MDNTTQIKSANQLYRESGSTLPFKQWIEREKEKGIFIPNVEAQNEMMNVMGSESESSGKQNHLVRNIAVLAIIGVLGYFVYRTIKNKTNE
jgi:phage anti-repressor protein